MLCAQSAPSGLSEIGGDPTVAAANTSSKGRTSQRSSTMNSDRSTRPPSRVDLVSIGETMVGFVGRDGTHDYVATMAGAESNVAVGMAQLGCRARWVSRVGSDPLGLLLEHDISARNVEVAVERDDSRPTGVLIKHVAGAERVAWRDRHPGDGRATRVGGSARARLQVPAGAVRTSGVGHDAYAGRRVRDRVVDGP
jgi:hypothetical protein